MRKNTDIHCSTCNLPSKHEGKCTNTNCEDYGK
jgi:hypothetical protein